MYETKENNEEPSVSDIDPHRPAFLSWNRTDRRPLPGSRLLASPRTSRRKAGFRE